MSETFDAVYYSQPVPSIEALTILGLVFDRVHFPGVYIPNSGVDEEQTQREIQRIISHGVRNVNDVQLIRCMEFALYQKDLDGFCHFTGTEGYMGLLEPHAGEIVNILDELIFGPPPPGFTPTHPVGFAKGLPGGGSVNGPSWISYPANALLYSLNRGLILINDDPRLPVPGLGGTDYKANAKVLSTILAFESVKLALPKLKSLQPKELMEFREQTREHVMPFRLAMLKLAKDLNAAIKSDMALNEVQKEAKFLVDTSVYPQLEELTRIIQEPSRPWYRRVIDIGQAVPEMITNFISMPKHLALANAFAKTAAILGDLNDDRLDKDRQMKRGGLHFLLKIRERMGT